MRKKLTILLLVFCLLCSGCAKGGGEREGTYSVYFMAARGGPDGAALASETRNLPTGWGPVDGLLGLLLSGPESGDLVSPFPRGVRLRSWRVQDRVAQVDLTEAYGGLSGMELTLADGCIVMTLCQLDAIDAVYLTVEGKARPFRDQVLSPADLLLDGGAEGPAQMEAELWFPTGEVLTPESRELKLAVGDDPAIALVHALLEGPDNAGFLPLCTEGTTLLSLKQAGHTYTLDLSQQWLEGERDPLRLQAVVRTLAALDPDAEVVFLVEGQRLERFGGLDLTQPLKADPAWAEEK